MGSNGCTVKEVVFVPYGECVKEEGAHALSGFVENLGHVVLVRQPRGGGDVDELSFTSLGEETTTRVITLVIISWGVETVLTRCFRSQMSRDREQPRIIRAGRGRGRLLMSTKLKQS